MKHITLLAVALTLVMGVALAVRAEPSSSATRWEYRIVSPLQVMRELERELPSLAGTKGEDPDFMIQAATRILDKHGAEGWELVPHHPDALPDFLKGYKPVLVFKRLKA